MKRLIILYVALTYLLSVRIVSIFPAVPVSKLEKMPASRAESNYAVGAEPYTDETRQTAAFSASLKAANVLPILIAVENQGDRPLYVSWENILLITPVGVEISPISGYQLAERLEGAPPEIPKSLDYVAVGCGLIGAVGALAAAYAIQGRRDSYQARLSAYQNTMLHQSALAKGESTQGFVFFSPMPGSAAFDQGTLKIIVTDVDKSISMTSQLPLSGLGFEEQIADNQ